MARSEISFDESYHLEEKKFTEQYHPLFPELDEAQLIEFHKQPKILQAERFLSNISAASSTLLLNRDNNKKKGYTDSDFSEDDLYDEDAANDDSKWNSVYMMNGKNERNPFHVASIWELIPDNEEEDVEDLLRKKMNPLERFIYKASVKERGDVLEREDPGISYQKSLVPYLLYNNKNRDFIEQDYIYLDNASIQYNKFDSMIQYPGMLSTIIPYIPEKKLKLELNKQFHNAFPQIQKSFSLTKLRTLKRKAIQICAISEHYCESDDYIVYDAGTMGLAFTYFEQLVIERYVDKMNRNLYMSVCIVLAFKFAQQREIDEIEEPLEVLFRLINSIFGVSREDIVNSEMIIFSQLNFSLHRPLDEFMRHVNYIYKELDTNIANDIGETMHNYYLQCYNYKEEMKDSLLMDEEIIIE